MVDHKNQVKPQFFRRERENHAYPGDFCPIKGGYCVDFRGHRLQKPTRCLSKPARSSGLPGATLATKAGKGTIAAAVFGLESSGKGLATIDNFQQQLINHPFYFPEIFLPR